MRNVATTSSHLVSLVPGDRLVCPVLRTSQFARVSAPKTWAVLASRPDASAPQAQLSPNRSFRTERNPSRLASRVSRPGSRSRASGSGVGCPPTLRFFTYLLTVAERTDGNSRTCDRSPHRGDTTAELTAVGADRHTTRRAYQKQNARAGMPCNRHRMFT